MALAGGDGEPANRFVGALGAVVGFGSVYNVLVAFAGFWGLGAGRWWPMWAAPVAGLLGLAVLRGDDGDTATDWFIGVALQLAVAVPPVLLLLSGRVSL